MGCHHPDAAAIEGDRCPKLTERHLPGNEDAASEGHSGRERAIYVRREWGRDGGPEKLGQAFPQKWSFLSDTKYINTDLERFPMVSTKAKGWIKEQCVDMFPSRKSILK